MRILIHIGLSKCGSTTLQHHFAAARDTLLAQGVDYPPPTGNQLGTPNTEVQRAWFAGQVGLDALVDTARAHTLVLSSEHISNRTNAIAPETLAAVGAWARDNGHQVEVLTVTRPLPQLMKSLYKQAIVNKVQPVRKMADLPTDYAEWLHDHAHSYYLEHMTDGHGLHVDLQDADWLTRVCDHVGVTLDAPPPSRNTSLPDAAAEILRQMNKLKAPPSGVYTARLLYLAYGVTSDVLARRAQRVAPEDGTPLSAAHFDALEFTENPTLKYTPDTFAETADHLRRIFEATPRAFTVDRRGFRHALNGMAERSA